MGSMRLGPVYALDVDALVHHLPQRAQLTQSGH